MTLFVLINRVLCLYTMKRTMPWSDDDDSSNDESSSLHSDSENDSKTGAKKSKGILCASSYSYVELYA